MQVQCTGCGKRLNVKDEYVGRKLKCPGCGATFTAAAVGSSVVLPGQRGAGGGGGSQKQKGGGGVHISPSVIVFAIIAISIPTLIFGWKFGPGRIRDQWAAQESDARDEVLDVGTRIIQSYLSHHGWDPNDSHLVPHAMDVTFITSPMSFSMPEKIGFSGTSTEGAISGNYFPKTREIEIGVEVGGSTLPTGVLVRRGNLTLNGTGRAKDGKIIAEIDGKPAEIEQPKPDEDHNAAADEKKGADDLKKLTGRVGG